jgi:hypothetical protein
LVLVAPSGSAKVFELCMVAGRVERLKVREYWYRRSASTVEGS